MATPVTEQVSPEEFKQLLIERAIRPASLEDVHHTHHQRKLYRHPNTGQYYVQTRRK